MFPEVVESVGQIRQDVEKHVVISSAIGLSALRSRGTYKQGNFFMIVVVKVKDISLVVWALGGEMFLEQCMRRSSQELLVVSCESVLVVMLPGNVVRRHRVIV